MAAERYVLVDKDGNIANVIMFEPGAVYAPPGVLTLARETPEHAARWRLNPTPVNEPKTLESRLAALEAKVTK